MTVQPSGRAASTHWNPEQYLRFADHRQRPALELLARVPLEEPRVIYDLGCGAGQMARRMAQRWPGARVVGLDSSREMLDKAAAQPGPVQWQQADIGNWSPPQPADLIYSNAALHWIDGHRELFPKLAGFLTPGGCLAVQMPLSWGAASHRLMRETLADGGPGGTALGDETLHRAMARKWVEDSQVYYDLLADRARTLDIWETEYLQVLTGEDAVLEWVKGTGLRPILDGLEGAQRQVFLAEYARRLSLAYPRRGDGRTLYPFRRLFMVAVF